MHRIIMYASTDETGLKNMERELLECLDAVNPSLNLDWVSWQLDHHIVSSENKFKILYFLINDSKITLVSKPKKSIEISKERAMVLKIEEEYYEILSKLCDYLNIGFISSSDLGEDDCKNIISNFKFEYKDLWKEL